MYKPSKKWIRIVMLFFSEKKLVINQTLLNNIVEQKFLIFNNNWRWTGATKCAKRYKSF